MGRVGRRRGLVEAEVGAVAMLVVGAVATVEEDEVSRAPALGILAHLGLEALVPLAPHDAKVRRGRARVAAHELGRGGGQVGRGVDPGELQHGVGLLFVGEREARADAWRLHRGLRIRGEGRLVSGKVLDRARGEDDERLGGGRRALRVGRHAAAARGVGARVARLEARPERHEEWDRAGRELADQSVVLRAVTTGAFCERERGWRCGCAHMRDSDARRLGEEGVAETARAADARAERLAAHRRPGHAVEVDHMYEHGVRDPEARETDADPCPRRRLSPKCTAKPLDLNRNQCEHWFAYFLPKNLKLPSRRSLVNDGAADGTPHAVLRTMSTRQNSTLVGGVLSATTALHSPRPSDEGPAPATAPRRKTAHGTKPGRASRAYAKHVCWVFVGTALYLTVTSAFYLLIESKPCEADNPETQERRGGRDGCTERWTVVDALYFVMSSMSTVGSRGEAGLEPRLPRGSTVLSRSLGTGPRPVPPAGPSAARSPSSPCPPQQSHALPRPPVPAAAFAYYFWHHACREH